MPVEEPIVEPDILTQEESPFSIEAFLRTEETKDLLRFSTAGSVDDGKSTLIGRLLYDSRNVYEDQLLSVTGRQTGQAQPTIDFALLTDGLRAEREQGITIDVAYRFFATQCRKFIIADTPGHEQYTRNMATGASTADLAIILIDARKGILPQSRRHAYIASLLGTRHLVGAINKMDLVDFSEDVYRTISRDLSELLAEYGDASLVTIPVSALNGDNVVEPSSRTPWYGGPTLLQHLASVPVWTDTAAQPFRMAVQRVIRPDQTYRGFAGQIASGTVRRGDRLTVYPSGRSSRVAGITTFDGDLDQATAPLSIALTLEDELDISRGDLLTDSAQPPHTSAAIAASIVWFDAQRLEMHRPYLLKHGTSTGSARVTSILHRINTKTFEKEAVSSLAMNDIGVVEVELTRPVFFDTYAENRALGSFILIDPHSNATVAAGMIRGSVVEATTGPLHQPALVLFPQGSTGISVLEHELIAAGAETVRTRSTNEKTLRGLLALGILVLVEASMPTATLAALADYPTVDAASFSSIGEIAALLLQSGKAAK